MSGTANLTPVVEGNALAVKHGAYSMAVVEPRAHEIAEALRPYVPRYTERLEPLLNMTALWMARCERAEVWLAEHGDTDKKGRLQPIHARLSTWYSELRRCLAALGMDNTASLAPGAAMDLAVELARMAATDGEVSDA